MNVFEWIVVFCMLIMAVCAIVFPILLLVQRKHHHKEWINIYKKQQEIKSTIEETEDEKE